MDEAIAPLILELWRAGIGTSASCQDHGNSGRVWVAFTTAPDAQAFLSITAGGDDDWQLSPRGDWLLLRRARVNVSVRIPHGDYDEVLARLRRHNTAAAERGRGVAP